MPSLWFYFLNVASGLFEVDAKSAAKSFAVGRGG
jgi:hypothetical protein